MSIEKRLRKYIIPNVFAMMGISCYVLADTYFISVAEGTNGIATLNLALPVYGLLFAIGSMIGIGSATRYSIRKALGDKQTDIYFSNALLWSGLISVIFMGIGFACPDKVLLLMGADSDILRIGVPYLRIVLLFTPCFILNYTFTAFVRNDGAPRIAMTATILSSMFNIVFDYVFMFPMEMGMNGAALATGLSPAISILICMFHYLSKKNTVIFRWMVPSISVLMQSCSLGIVAFVGEIASGITTLVFNFILLSLAGNVAVAAYGVVANLALVGTAIFNGISQGLQPLASEAHGMANHEDEKKIVRHSLFIGMVVAVVLVGGIWLKTEPFVQIFNSENSIVMAEYAKKGLRLYFLGFLLAGINIIQAGFLSATGHAMESSVIAITRGIVAIILFAVVLSRIWGMTGVWMAFPAAELITFVGTIIYSKRSNCMKSKDGGLS